jgi:sortase (surface protein transpeptidase)
MGEDGPGGAPSGSDLPGDGALTKAIPAITSRQADWWDPAWDAHWWDEAMRPGGPDAGPEVSSRSAAGLTAVGQARPAPAERTPAGGAPSRGVEFTAAGEPSWRQVIATTVSLWLSRRWRGVSGRWREVRASRARLVAASMLGAGLLAAGAGTAGLAASGFSPVPAAQVPASPSPVPVPTARAVTPARLATAQRTPRPVRLTIPAIGVRTALVDLGLNRDGTLQVPASTAVAGWYAGSPPPGAVGSAVIAGHVDSRSGPGVFFWLRAMRAGERVYVERADRTMAVFTVTGVRQYAKDEFPTAAVYGAVPDAELRLITCGGSFDRSAGSYLSNIVVYARLTG